MLLKKKYFHAIQKNIQGLKNVFKVPKYSHGSKLLVKGLNKYLWGLKKYSCFQKISVHGSQKYLRGIRKCSKENHEFFKIFYGIRKKSMGSRNIHGLKTNSFT